MKNTVHNGVEVMQYDLRSPVKFSDTLKTAKLNLESKSATTGKITFPIIGPSGVGKSTILNLIGQYSDLRIQDVDQLRPAVWGFVNNVPIDATISSIGRGKHGNFVWDAKPSKEELDLMLVWMRKFDIVSGLTPELRVALAARQGSTFGFFLCVPFDHYLENLRRRNAFRSKDLNHRAISRLEYNRKWESAAKHKYTCVLYQATDQTEAVRTAGTIMYLLQNSFKKEFTSKLDLSLFVPSEVKFASGWSMKY